MNAISPNSLLLIEALKNRIETPFLCRLFLETVAITADSLDQRPLVLQFGPQFFDVGIHRAQITKVVVAPNGVQDLLARNRNILVRAR